MSDFEERESIVISNEGQKIFGVLHIPKGVVKPPCVLICHGLAGHKTGRYRVYVELAEALVKAQIAVMRFDFRGSGDSEGDFSKMTLHGEVSDALKAIQFIYADPRFDQNAIGIFGRSLGGAVAILTAGAFGHVKSMALWAPIFSGNQWHHHWTSIRDGQLTEVEAIEIRRINGQVAGLEFYEELFHMNIEKPLSNLSHIPLLLIHGEQDMVVNIEHSQNYLREREHAEAVTEFIRLPSADHDFTFINEREYAIQRTAEWFKISLC